MAKSIFEEMGGTYKMQGAYLAEIDRQPPVISYKCFCKGTLTTLLFVIIIKM